MAFRRRSLDPYGSQTSFTRHWTARACRVWKIRFGHYCLARGTSWRSAPFWPTSGSPGRYDSSGVAQAAKSARRGSRVGSWLVVAASGLAVATACASPAAPGIVHVRSAYERSATLGTGGAEPGAPVESRTPDANQPEAASGTSQDLLPWLVGRWKAPRKTCWPIDWSEPNELQARRGKNCDAAGVQFELELTFTPGPGKIDGVLEAVSPEGRRHQVVAFAIARDGAHHSLVWNEGGVRYVLSSEPADAGLDYALARFYLARNPSSRSPYPIVIDFALMAHELTLRRAHGPQHGAAVDRIWAFQRQ